MMKGAGHAGIAGMISVLVVTPRGSADGHGHDRFAWSPDPAGGAPVAGGTDIARLDGQGRISDVVGFLDHAPGR